MEVASEMLGPLLSRLHFTSLFAGSVLEVSHDGDNNRRRRGVVFVSKLVVVADDRRQVTVVTSFVVSGRKDVSWDVPIWGLAFVEVGAHFQALANVITGWLAVLLGRRRSPAGVALGLAIWWIELVPRGGSAKDIPRGFSLQPQP